MTSDRELVEAVKTGTPGAFERLVRAHQALCWHIVLRIVRDPDEARDLCQETFLRVHRYLHQYRYESALKTWIGRIAYSIALRHLERRRTSRDAWIGGEEGQALLDRVDSGEDVLLTASREQTTAMVMRQMRALTPVQRTVLTLYHLEEMSIPEVAEITGLPAGTVKSHLYRARLRLRALLEKRIGEPA